MSPHFTFFCFFLPYARWSVVIRDNKDRIRAGKGEGVFLSNRDAHCENACIQYTSSNEYCGESLLLVLTFVYHS